MGKQFDNGMSNMHIIWFQTKLQVAISVPACSPLVTSVLRICESMFGYSLNIQDQFFLECD